MQPFKPSGRKRKRDATDNGNNESLDTEIAYGGNQVLPVASLPSSFSGEPEDGAQYLALVRRDARSLPHITRVSNPYAATSTNNTGATPPKVVLRNQLPSHEWRSTFELRFNAFRKNIRHKPIHVGRPPDRVALPRWTDREAWWAFLNGLDPPARKTDQERKPAFEELDDAALTALIYDSDDDLLPTSRAQAAEMVPRSVKPEPNTSQSEEGEILSDVDNTHEADTSQPSPLEPSKTILDCINHRVCLQILKYYKHWIERAAERELVLSPSHGRWIFALLAHIDAQLLADEMSVVRQVAKACIRLLKVDHSQEDEADSGDEGSIRDGTGLGRTACWLVLGAVALGFAQRDLWDEAASILSA